MNTITRTADETVTRLLELPQRLDDARIALLERELEHARAKEALRAEEDRLLAAGVIDGKNEAIRTAQLRRETLSFRERVRTAEIKVEPARLALLRLQDEFSALRAVARLLGRE